MTLPQFQLYKEAKFGLQDTALRPSTCSRRSTRLALLHCAPTALRLTYISKQDLAAAQLLNYRTANSRLPGHPEYVLPPCRDDSTLTGSVQARSDPRRQVLLWPSWPHVAARERCRSR